MEQTARALHARSQPDVRVPTVVVGTVLGSNQDGRLIVQVGGDTDPITAAGDRRYPNPGPGPIVLLYAAGQYTVLACPAAPVSSPATFPTAPYPPLPPTTP